jgi:hypothetical protein
VKHLIFLALLFAAAPAWAQDASSLNAAATQPSELLAQILFPGAAAQGTPQTQVGDVPGCQVVHLTTASGEHVVAMYAAAQDSDGNALSDPKNRPTILYFYGNASSITFSLKEFGQFCRPGANVLMPDYVGYGMSSGKPSEASLYETADACYDELTHKRTVAPGKIVAVGWSLGAAVAIDLASRKPVAAVAVFNAFTSTTDMARQLLPKFPPEASVVWRFDNLKKISSIKVPTFICNSAQDEIVPPVMSDQLAAAAAGPVTRVRIPDADHNGIFQAHPDAVFIPLQSFIASATQK